MFHDHDDVLNEGSLVQMLAEFEKNEDLFVVMAQLKDFFCSNLSQEERKKIIMRQDPYFGLFSGAILMKKEVFDVVGLFDENIEAGDIIEWSNKVEKYKLPTKRLAFVSSNRRIHDSNFGRTSKKTAYKDYSAVLRAKIKMAQ